jgi:hypothetical protein
VKDVVGPHRQREVHRRKDTVDGKAVDGKKRVRERAAIEKRLEGPGGSRDERDAPLFGG